MRAIEKIVRLTIMVSLVLSFVNDFVNAQTCVQADLSHPLQVTLTWTDNSNNETNFIIERQLNGGAFAALAPIAPNTTQAIDTTVVRSTVDNTYTYRLKAVNGTLSSAFTTPACITFAPNLIAPSAPSGFTVSQNSASPTDTLTLSWDDVTNETGYEIVGRPANGPRIFIKLVSVAQDVTNWDWTGLQRSKTFCARVRAMRGTAASAYTNISCATTSR